MPKMKTHRGAAKRLKATASGRLKRHKANKSHILTKKTTKRKRGLRKATLVSKAEEKRYQKLLPYGA
jgi:large subunit ribosomal protein L35